MPNSYTSDSAIMRTLWLILLASIISLFPFTIFSTFLVPIAESTGHTVAEVGSLRGLGGIASLVVGIGFAPLINRFVKSYISIYALLLLTITALIGTIGTYPALIIFCFGIGAATALLMPSLFAIATEQFKYEADIGRAATIVTATQSLGAVMAGPVIGGLALMGGWRGALFVTAGISLFVMTALIVKRHSFSAPSSKSSVKYLAAFRQVAQKPLISGLIAIAMLRTTAFMGSLAYIAALYNDRFQMDAYAFTFVWTLSGLSFFIGNFFAGKYLNNTAGNFQHIKTVLAIALIAASLAAFALFAIDTLFVAIIATIGMGASHAVIAAGVMTLIVRRSGEVKNPALSINSAGMSLGVFIGAFVGGLGISIAGYVGAGIALAGATIVALGILFRLQIR